MLSAVSDAEIVARIGARTADVRAAEAELCRRFGPRAHLYGLRHLRDEERARDLAQAVLLVVLEAVRGGRIDDPTRLDRFVLGTCRNLARRIREQDRRAEPTDDEHLDVLASVPELDVIDVRALVRCLTTLDERGRSVVHLSFHQERSAEQIAAELGTTAGNVRVVRHRAVAQLRRCLDHGGAAS